MPSRTGCITCRSPITGTFRSVLSSAHGFFGEGIAFRHWRFLFALAIAFVTGVQNVYYAAMFAQLVLIAGVLQAVRRGWRAILPAASIIGVVAGVFLVMNLNTFFYHILHGGNPGAVTRNYEWLEVYGLKIVDMIVPPPDHRFPPFAAWGANHVKEVLLSPGELPPLRLSRCARAGRGRLADLHLPAPCRRAPAPAARGLDHPLDHSFWVGGRV